MSHPRDMSLVKTVHFDRGTHTLRIEFDSGAVYDFADVPERLYDELARSPRPDVVFREQVRDEYVCTRVGDVDLAELAHERREDAILGPPLAEVVDPGDGAGRAAHRRHAPHAEPSPSQHVWVVDVLEEDSAAIEVDGRRITPVPRWLLPADARDGDVLRVSHSRSGTRSALSIEVDRGATRAALERSRAQLDAAPPPIGQGDIDLA